MDVVVAGDSQQSIISNSSVVNPDMGKLGDGGCLDQTGIIQPCAAECQKIQLAALQGGQTAAADGGVTVQQQMTQLGHSRKNRETGVGKRTVLHAEVGHAFMPSKWGKQFIGYRIAFHMKAHQSVTSQLLHEFHSQLRNFKRFLSVQSQNAVFPDYCPRPFR